MQPVYRIGKPGLPSCRRPHRGAARPTTGANRYRTNTGHKAHARSLKRPRGRRIGWRGIQNPQPLTPHVSEEPGLLSSCRSQTGGRLTANLALPRSRNRSNLLAKEVFRRRRAGVSCVLGKRLLAIPATVATLKPELLRLLSAFAGTRVLSASDRTLTSATAASEPLLDLSPNPEPYCSGCAAAGRTRDIDR